MTSLAPSSDFAATSEIAAPLGFVDRRLNRDSADNAAAGQPRRERRQFSNSHSELSTAAQELAAAIDGYKLTNRRRFIDFDEMLGILASLGYHK